MHDKLLSVTINLHYEERRKRRRVFRPDWLAIKMSKLLFGTEAYLLVRLCLLVESVCGAVEKSLWHLDDKQGSKPRKFAKQRCNSTGIFQLFHKEVSVFYWLGSSSQRNRNAHSHSFMTPFATSNRTGWSPRTCSKFSQVKPSAHQPCHLWWVIQQLHCVFFLYCYFNEKNDQPLIFARLCVSWKTRLTNHRRAK